MTIFFRVLDVPPQQKAAVLRNVTSSGCSGGALDSDIGRRVFTRDACSFTDVPGVSFLYWLPNGLLGLYGRRGTWEGFETRCGLGTLDDFQFLRCWWEPHASLQDWHPFAKGGGYSPLYSDIPLSISWVREGRGLKASVEQKVGSASRKVQGEDHYFLPGITWPRLPHNLGSFQLLPAGSIYSDGGPAMFAETDRLVPAVALLNSAPYLYLLDNLMPRGSEGGQTLKYETGYVTSAPLPPVVSAEIRDELRDLARRGWLLSRKLQSTTETARAFVLPESMGARLGTGVGVRHDIHRDLLAVQARVDDIAFNLYGLSGSSRDAIETWCSERRARVDSPGESSEVEGLSESGDPDDGFTSSELTSPSCTVADFSWIVGVLFGRFDPRLATGERGVPPEPEPFDPLPARSPAMWPDDEEPKNAPSILVDDEGHADDLIARLKHVAEQVRWQAPEDVRKWLAREFFPLHIRMYSKSRRKAPIYWQLATPSGSYSVWLYLHAFTRDTLFRVQHDYAGPKLLHEERRLESMRQEFGDNPSAAQRKRLAAQEDFVGELRGFLEEVQRVAPLWNPDHDDGVIINFAPLWRLVPQCKSWQKELKATWDALCDGKYDWAHLAMHLWPERVVPKCAKDRSLAIAHRLEEVFWEENGEGKWEARETPTRSIEELIRERTSPAVKAALQSLLQAPVAQNGRSRSRGRRASVGSA